ncbi:MAG: carbohydrate ABC transporter permease [Gammaproteobacteria bacterium]|nr:carbohydrate ABC transporter permease [Gammaproteobacteria bacterium]
MRISSKHLIYFLAIMACAWVLIPIYVITISAFQGPEGVYAWPKSFWPTFSLESLEFFFSIPQVWKSALNSIYAASLTMCISLALGAPAGYAMARYDFRGKGLYRIAVLSTRAFPVALLALPLAVRFINMGIYDSVIGVAIVHSILAMPFAVLITYSLFLGIPRELEEAAWTLGCSRIEAFIYVVMPLALPSIAATAIFAFIISWNEVFAAAVLTTQNRTLPAFLMAGLNEAPLHFRFAGGFFLIVPSLIFIFIVRKYLFSMWGIANR